MSCKHYSRTQHWIDGAFNDWTGEYDSGHWEWEEKSTTVDIDLHRYKCTMCGEIMYYSGRAKEYYEEGKTFEWIKGLKGNGN